MHNQTGNVVIRGLPYARTRYLHGYLHSKQNEVCLILEIDADDARPDEEQALVEIEPEDILKKRILTNTNKAFPNCRFDEQAYATLKQREEDAPLACRWKMRVEYKDASQRRAGRFQGHILEHFSERDSHKIKKRNLGVDKERSREWRGETVPGGSAFSEPDSVKDENQDGGPARSQMYAFAEVSAGPGGASRGAAMAGLKVVLATESCHHACSSYRANFPGTELCQVTTTEFAADETQRPVDLLHISSSALTEVGYKPEADNKPEAAKKLEAVRTICTDLLKKTHSRFVLMVQPATITSEGMKPFLNAVIKSFTDLGYSFQWKIVNLVEYGLPQMRKRFIMIASAPGEKLPSWPAATHSSDPTGDQQPFATEEDAIGGLTPELHSLHDPEALPVMDCAVRDASKPMDAAINASGSTNHHADGERDFTLRELASLQGFPTYHHFEGAYIKKQIGNSFPPLVAMAFYQHLRQHMEEVDGVQAGLVQPEELAGDHNVSSLEAHDDIMLEEAPDYKSPSRLLDAASIGKPIRPLVLQHKRAAILPSPPPMSPSSSSTGPTVSSEASQNLEPTSPASHTPSPTQQLPTPSTNGRFKMGEQKTTPGRKRGRSLFEEPESDGDDDDDGGPSTLQTPSKRPRVTLGREETRTVSRSSSDTTGTVENVTMSEDADELGSDSADDEEIATLAVEI